MQTAAHPGDVDDPERKDRRYWEAAEHRGDNPEIPLSDMIQWIRIYKNPETVPKSQLQSAGTAYSHPIFTFGELTTFLYPSFRGPNYGATDAQSPDIFWVKFHPTNHDDPGGLIDTGDDSGRVTATENTAVAVGDRVAIAIRVKDLGYFAHPDIAIGPLTTRQTITGAVTIPRPERKWRLSPNVPLRHISGGSPVRTPAGLEHTLVYQFKVTADHAADLNADGPWLKYDFDPYKPFPGGDKPLVGNDPWQFEDSNRIASVQLAPPGNLAMRTIGENTRLVTVGFEWLHGDPP